ncbi:ROK family protein [bacterium]|nr:ROK family protein [bacterium]
MVKKTYTIGIDLGGTNIKSGIADKDGKILTSRTVHSPVELGGEAVLDAIIQTEKHMLDYAKKRGVKVIAAGVGSPGGIDIIKGIVLETTPNIPNWKGMKIKKRLEKAMGIPCFVDNDANLFLLAEQQFGAAKGYNHAFGLTIGTGIGGALVINGEIYRGSRYVGAEMGHMPIIVDGRQCRCGLKGCLEVYTATPALKRIYKSKNKKAKPDISTKTIFAHAKKGEKAAVETIDYMAEHLASGIAAVANVLNPEVVILGGGVSEAGEFLRKKVEDATLRRALPVIAATLKVKMATLGNKAGWLGASAFARMMLKQ